MKRPLILVALALAVAACNGDDTAEPTTAPAVTSPSTSAAPTSTSAPTTEPSASTSTPMTAAPPSSVVVTTAAPSTSPVVTDPDSTDWRLILETLGRRRQDLYSAPDVSRIGEVCAQQSECAEQLDVQLADMASKGWHVEGADPFTVLSAEVDEFTGPSVEEAEVIVLATVVQRLAFGGNIVDSAGAVVAELEADTEEGFNSRGRAFLARVGPPEDPWRIVSQETIEEIPAG